MKKKSDLFPTLLSAAAIGVLQLGVTISLAALIFSGPLEAGAARASTGFLLGTAIVSLVIGATTNMQVVIAGAQDTAAVMTVAVAAAIVSSSQIKPEEAISTVFVMLAITATLTGVVFWLIGRFGLTSFVRFLPFPVISGFTAGTGWLLMLGGITVMHRQDVTLGGLGNLFQWGQFQFILPGIGLAVMMLIVVNTERLPNTLVSLAILLGSVVFHLIGRSVTTAERLEDDGWLIGPFEEGAGWKPISPSDFADTNWTVLFNSSLLVLAVVLVSVIGLLLNLSGLEGGPDKQIDMNNEIQAAGLSNIAVGAAGGMIGYHLFGDITLARQLDARGRIVPLTIGLLAGSLFLIGPGVLALVPRSIAGGVLAGLGLNLFVSWARNSLPRMSKTDQLLSGLILVAIAALGVLVGVLVGVIVAAALFIVKYSRIDPVRHSFDATGHSTIDRDARHQRLLDDAAGSILALELHGYLFFGSITRLQRQVEQHVSDESEDGASTRFVIFDFSRVSGIDSTAAASLQTIGDRLSTSDITAVFSGVGPAVADELIRDEIDLGENHRDLDHAIAACEDAIVDLDTGVEASADYSAKPFAPGLMATLGLPVVQVQAGETLIDAGATDTDVYFVERGTLTAWLATDEGRPIRMRQVLPGSALGEIAFCTGAARTATVIADTDAIIHILTRERFDELAASDPQAALAVQHELLQRLGSRVSSTSAMVRDLLR